MKGNEKVLEKLNFMLADELTAISQYMVHAEMCDDWGYTKLSEAIEKRAIEEMKHAEKLIGRILFLEGRPIVSKLNDIHIGEDVPAILDKDHTAELGAIKFYNEVIKDVTAVGDHGTADFLKLILLDEEAHIDWIEAQMSQIDQMELQNYLTEQL